MQAFDLETSQLMERALRRAWHMLLRTRPQAAQDESNQQSLLARAIMDVAGKGERNEIRLAVLAVAKLDGYEPTLRNARRRRGGSRQSAA